MSSGPAAISCDLEIAAVSSLIEKGLLYVSVLLDLKFNGLFSAWRRNDWNFVLYCSDEELSEKVWASEFAVSGISVIISVFTYSVSGD